MEQQVKLFLSIYLMLYLWKPQLPLQFCAQLWKGVPTEHSNTCRREAREGLVFYASLIH